MQKLVLELVILVVWLALSWVLWKWFIYPAPEYMHVLFIAVFVSGGWAIGHYSRVWGRSGPSGTKPKQS